MGTQIATLPLDVINLIAAGEVIDSLAAVVRELVENALDAEATRIVISLCPDLWRVQIADNGRGMSLEDLHNCAKAHSTSKLRSTDDLWKITSLGFRGEALHSLTQVADLEIISRPTFDPKATGWRIIYNRQGEAQQIEPTAIAPGTIVTVSNLFSNLPVRRQGLPPLAQQLKAVQGIIQQVALCHPRVTWQVRQNEQFWFNISLGLSSHQILPQILRQVRLSDLQLLTLEVETPQESEVRSQKSEKPITLSSSLASPPKGDRSVRAGYQLPITNPKSKIELVLGLPDRCHRRRPDWVRVAINGRMVRSPELEQTILTSLARTLPRDRYPICFLHLNVCPSQIDWNRHPAKAEIYLHSLPFWQEQVAQAIEQALRLNAATLPDALQNQRVSQLLKTAEATGTYKVRTEDKGKDLSFMELQAVAQVRNTYIVAEHTAGLWLVEQHIAHERVLYEQLQDDWRLVPLETPIILSQLTSAQVEQIQRLGLEIEPFGEQLWAVRNAPEMLQQRDDCADALIELSWGGDLQTAQVATACRSAIRNGTPLNLSDMQTLLDQWKMARNPRTCPHGRPIYLSLEETSLARFFRRHWVIGKSHGI